MFNFLNPYALVGGLVFLLTTGAGAYFYYQKTERELKELYESNATLRVNQEQLLNTIEENQEVYRRVVEELREQDEKENRLQARLDAAEDYNRTLMNKLRVHDLTYLSLMKPGLIETRVNNATKKVFDDIQSVTRD